MIVRMMSYRLLFLKANNLLAFLHKQSVIMRPSQSISYGPVCDSAFCYKNFPASVILLSPFWHQISAFVRKRQCYSVATR